MKDYTWGLRHSTNNGPPGDGSRRTRPLFTGCLVRGHYSNEHKVLDQTATIGCMPGSTVHMPLCLKSCRDRRLEITLRCVRSPLLPKEYLSQGFTKPGRVVAKGERPTRRFPGSSLTFGFLELLLEVMLPGHTLQFTYFLYFSVRFPSHIGSMLCCAIRISNVDWNVDCIFQRALRLPEFCGRKLV